MSNGYVSCNLNTCNYFEDELFKIAAVFYYASKYKKSPVFHLNNNRNMYKNLLNTMCKEEYENLNFTIVEEKNDNYTEFEDIDGNVFLEGNYTSLKYFTSFVKNRMVNIIYSYEDYMFDAYTYYENIKSFFADLDNVEITDDDMISIYINIDNYKLDVETITKLLANARENNKKYVAIFSNDISMCEEFIKDDYVYFVKTNIKYNIDEFQFVILSFFKNNIIYNSKYSLYASLISSFKDKLIINYEPDTKNIIVKIY